MVVTLALAGAALADDAPLPGPVEQSARTYITRAALEAPIRLLSSAAQLAMLSAWLVAQADAMPTWKPGDEFEAARKRALAAAGSP